MLYFYNEAEYKKRKPKNGIYPQHSLKYHESHAKRNACQECHPGIGHGKDLNQGLNDARMGKT
ncbi:MAG: hypothetical protein M0Z31_06550 [Clostridia bacterium]|nr:hypothetical protein [Clostridia bacterium]